jgi:hypothetical protein
MKIGFNSGLCPNLKFSLCVSAFLCDSAVNLRVKAVHRRDAEDAELRLGHYLTRASILSIFG